MGYFVLLMILFSHSLPEALCLTQLGPWPPPSLPYPPPPPWASCHHQVPHSAGAGSSGSQSGQGQKILILVGCGPNHCCQRAHHILPQGTLWPPRGSLRVSGQHVSCLGLPVVAGRVVAGRGCSSLGHGGSSHTLGPANFRHQEM